VLGQKAALCQRENGPAREEGKREKAYDGWDKTGSWARIKDKYNWLQKNLFEF
jgi:hypothetical protein